MKKIFIMLLLLSSESILANDETCHELHSVVNGGIFDWLNKDMASTNIHPHAADPGPVGDENCLLTIPRAIKVSTSGNASNDKAYYTKYHNDADQVRLRFILNTENMLESFSYTDSLVIYDFRYIDGQDIDRPFLKVRLKKTGYVDFEGTIYWQMTLQWFDTINGGSTFQHIEFNDNQQFVDFNFYWKKMRIVNSNNIFLYYKSQAGVTFKVGNGVNNSPRPFVSPYTYDGGNHLTNNNLEGFSRLGYINNIYNTPQFGDVLHIISADLYQD